MDKVGSSADRGIPTLAIEQDVTTRLGRGRRLGRYRLLDLVRQGKRTELYRAEAADRDGLSALYAVKITRAELDESLDAARELSCEIQVLSELDHPNVVRLEDHGNVAGAIFLALEYLEGCSVSQLMQARLAARSWVPADVAAHVAFEMAGALAHVHGATIESLTPTELVHRDVRPGHVMLLRSGAVKLIDFGAARCADRRVGRRLTNLDVPQGTIAYLAPEQVLGQPVDRRADLFSLGVVLWEMLAQRRLFLRATARDTASAIVEAAIPSLSSLRSDIPQALAASVSRALARDPQQRYQTAEEMAADLGRCTPGRELMARGVAVLVEATMDRGDSGLLPLPPRTPPVVARSARPAPPPLPPTLPTLPTLPTSSLADQTVVSGPPARLVLDRVRAKGRWTRVVGAAVLALLGFAAGAIWQRGRAEEASESRTAKPAITTRAPVGVTFEPINRPPDTPVKLSRRRNSSNRAR